jgi:hypothetical protein
VDPGCIDPRDDAADGALAQEGRERFDLGQLRHANSLLDSRPHAPPRLLPPSKGKCVSQ